jgi:hypothetical protein
MINNNYIDNTNIDDDIEEYPEISIKKRSMRRFKTKHIIKKLIKKMLFPGYLKKTPLLNNNVKISMDVFQSFYKDKIYELKKYIELKEQYNDYLEDISAI